MKNLLCVLPFAVFQAGTLQAQDISGTQIEVMVIDHAEKPSEN